MEPDVTDSARRSRGDDGIAMITVLLVMMVLTTMALTSLSFATGSLNLSRRDQDWGAALSAAEAGVDDYVLHLNQNAAYYQYSDTNAPPDGNLAFTTWVPLPGPSNAASFRYSAVSTVEKDGNVRVTSTGRVRNVTRTVTSIVRRRNFLDYLYFTDIEAVDPAALGISGTGCTHHFYDSPSRSSGCQDIVFFGDSTRQDVIDGPLHTNDAILINGNPWFKGASTTSWNDPAGKRWRDDRGSGSTPIFASTCTAPAPADCVPDPKYAAPLDLPPSNLTLSVFAARPYNGCLFTGPTRITLVDGVADVFSPYTKVSNCGFPAQTTTPATATQRFTLPTDGVIYVQAVPTDPTNPNYSPIANNCTVPSGIVPTGDTTGYKCSSGDAFISGQLKGQLTIGSYGNIVVVGDTTYKTAPKDGGTDLLGLIADQFVEIYHPVNNGSNTSFTGGPVTKVDAAILSVAHSFRVQNHATGPTVGTLHVNGAIGQKFRGPVGTTGGTGYIKDYKYDERLKYLSPPHFLDPVKSAWIVRTYAEVKTAFPATAP
jgi:Tfp pilus assembly protein PilX